MWQDWSLRWVTQGAGTFVAGASGSVREWDTRALVSWTEASRGMLEGPESAVRGSVPKFSPRGIVGVSEERWPSRPCFQEGNLIKKRQKRLKNGTNSKQQTIRVFFSTEEEFGTFRTGFAEKC